MKIAVVLVLCCVLVLAVYASSPCCQHDCCHHNKPHKHDCCVKKPSSPCEGYKYCEDCREPCLGTCTPACNWNEYCKCRTVWVKTCKTKCNKHPEYVRKCCCCCVCRPGFIRDKDGNCRWIWRGRDDGDDGYLGPMSGEFGGYNHEEL